MAGSIAGERIQRRAEAEEAKGNVALAKQLMKQSREADLDNVFGVDSKPDGHGGRIEQGIGSDSNLTAQHIEAVRKYEGEAAAQAVIARAERLKANK